MSRSGASIGSTVRAAEHDLDVWIGAKDTGLHPPLRVLGAVVDQDTQRRVKASVFGIYPDVQVMFCSTVEPIDAPLLDTSACPGGRTVMSWNKARYRTVMEGVPNLALTDEMP